MTKLTLRPDARANLLRLRQQADAFAQRKFVTLTTGDTWTFLDNAPITPEFAAILSQVERDIEAGYTVRLTGMSDEELEEHFARTFRALPVPDDE